MKYVKNESDTARRIDDGTGRLLRVAPGAVAALPDDAKTDDVDSITSASEDDFNSFVASGNPSTARTMTHSVQEEVAASMSRLGQITVAVPLAQVIGDSDAPFGPDNGTITTKQEAAAESPEAKRAFADHENIDAEKEGLSEIEVTQAKAKAAVDEIAKDLQAGAASTEDDAPKPKRTSAKASGTITTADTPSR